MENKIISINISPETDEEINENAGVMWEHNATSLVFNIDSAYVDDYRYYIEYRSLIGTLVRTEYLELNTATNTITYDIPVTMTSLRGVECYFNIVKIDEDGQTVQIIKPKRFYLQFDYAPDTDNSLEKEYDFTINALLEAIRLGVFQGSSGGVTVVDSKMSDTSSNPVQNKVAKAYVDTAVVNAQKYVDSQDERIVKDLGDYIVKNLVHKEEGKGLSSNDFTDEYKNKLDNAETELALKVTDVQESTEDGGSNVVTFSDGNTLTVKNGSKGLKGDKGDTGATGSKGADGKDYDYIESYVKTEADSVIERVIEAQNGRTFTFACISDIHYGMKGYTDGIKHAAQALKYIDSRVKLDAFAVLGDYSHKGSLSTEYEAAVQDFMSVNGLFNPLRVTPNLRVQGNHDFDTVHSQKIYRYIQGYSDNVVWGSQSGGYFYRDFENHKVRVICLNTTEQSNTGLDCSYEQYQWFINSLDLTDKEDNAEWQILILSHIPIDWFETGKPQLFYQIIDAYQNGTSWSYESLNCDYTGKNSAKLIANIHGHIHNLLVKKVIAGYPHSTTETVDFYRVSTPNACDTPENSKNGVYDNNPYGEDISYPKTHNTAQDTAFCVYCIDLDTYTIKAICYGAGYDRELNYNSGMITETYTIQNVLTNVTNSNTAKNVNIGESYSAVLTAINGSISSVTITMNGIDITSTAYADGTITIEEVTGNVIITAVAEMESEEPTYTNVLLIAESGDSTEIYNGVGYKANTRYSKTQQAELTRDGTYISGYIERPYPATIYLKNVNMSKDNSNTMVYWFNEKGTATDDYNATLLTDTCGAVWDDNGMLVSFNCAINCKYIRIQCSGFDETSIITVNETIE